MFINDPTNREVFNYTDDLFGEMEEINEQVRDGFRYYLYHYPDSALPRTVPRPRPERAYGAPSATRSRPFIVPR